MGTLVLAAGRYQLVRKYNMECTLEIDCLHACILGTPEATIYLFIVLSRLQSDLKPPGNHD